MLHSELNGLVRLFSEYKRLILPKKHTLVKAYSVRSESFFGSFFIFGYEKGRRLKAAAFFLFSVCQRADHAHHFSRLSPSAINRKPTSLQVNSAK